MALLSTYSYLCVIIKNQAMILQKEIKLAPRPKGFHLITGEIARMLPELPTKGIVNLFLKHTSAALTLTENADPDVRRDLAEVLERVAPEGAPYYLHTAEGDDDMAAHAKTVMLGATLTIPVTNGYLNMGTWQGIFLCEFRDHGGPRDLVITVIGE